ncbi:MAG: tetratricopeptide (TPR) repeat protein [Chlamydiales bacterium]
MPYLIILIVIILLGLAALRAWLIRRIPSQSLIEEAQNNVAHQIALANWEAAAKQLKPLQKRRLGGAETAILHVQILRGNKQLSEAISFIEESLDFYQHNFALIRERGRLMLETGDPLEALKAFKQCEPVLRSEEDMLDLTTALFQTGDVDTAWYYLQDLVKVTSSGRLLALAGDCHFYLGEYQKAIAYYQRTQDTGWNNYQVLSRMGHSLRNIGKIDKAEDYFRQILQKDPADVASTLGLGACLEVREQYEEALLIYQTGKAWDVGDQNILRQAGICAVYTKKYTFAELYLRESLKRGGKSPQTLAFLGYSLEHQQRWQEAEKIYIKLVEEYPDQIAGYRALAWLYGVGHSTEMDAEQGLAMARRALELQPDTASWEMLSACEARIGNFKTAHNIQERLSSQTRDETTRLRRCRAMRALRKNMPLDEQHVVRALVA